MPEGWCADVLMWTDYGILLELSALIWCPLIVLMLNFAATNLQTCLPSTRTILRHTTIGSSFFKCLLNYRHRRAFCISSLIFQNLKLTPENKWSHFIQYLCTSRKVVLGKPTSGVKIISMLLDLTFFNPSPPFCFLSQPVWRRETIWILLIRTDK